MTGRYPIHTGMQHSVIFAALPYGVGLDEVFLPQYLKEQGYQTHAIGKWHLGFFKSAYIPTSRGFDSFFGFWSGKNDYWDHSQAEEGFWGLDLRNNTTPVRDEWGHYGTDLFAEQAVDVINAHDTSKPMFMYLAHQAVHNANSHQSIQAPKDVINRFKHIKDERRRIFAAMATVLDQSVGKVVDALKARNMYNNSVIIFSTDNGGPAAGLDGNSACNYPLRGMKTTLWEGGVRGVALVHSPLLGTKGRVSMDMMHATDWVPTLYGLAGGNTSKLENLDGFDMWPTLTRGEQNPRTEILLNIDGDDSALRFQQWKFVNTSTARSKWYPRPGLTESSRSFRDTPLKNVVINCSGEPPATPAECREKPCLFNIEDDPCEYYNVAEKYPDVLNKLLSVMEKYKKSMVPPRYKPKDEAADPNAHGGVWTPWRD
ncbi:arylsulfatase I-like isoform X2 [Orbicella faveolata]|uniref:arylsulfatase I-like isoform X2 n=1 Tax=Orbicella faveolata TaxID=48498 RepID=UPI0009E34674|nr:arylsulfatase I-like isoform X2 [Orbicella faveolata]